MKVVPHSFFARSAVEVAPDLIGKILIRRLGDEEIVCRIVETEAYTQEDPACHAFKGKTHRNEVMFGEPGLIYVYFIYGMYHCLNFVTNKSGCGDAVLIRGLEVLSCKEKDKIDKKVAAGPGKLCRFLSIDRTLNGKFLDVEGGLWLMSDNFSVENNVHITKRIGISQGKDADWRWCLKGSHGVSKP